MLTTRELYCSRCQLLVRPVKSLINYCCPKCGLTFLASQIEQADAGESKEHAPASKPAVKGVP
jgi:hypothetical protein